MRKQALCTDVIYIKSFSTMMNNTKINIIGILCIVFYNYLSLIRYYSKLVKLGANISQFQMKSLFLFLKKLNKTYNFVFIICLFFYHLGRFCICVGQLYFWQVEISGWQCTKSLLDKLAKHMKSNESHIAEDWEIVHTTGHYFFKVDIVT